MTDDPSELMKDQEPGSVIYAFAGGAEVMIEFLIREASETIQGFPSPLPLAIRSGAIWREGVLVVIVLLAVEPERAIYPTFWNFWHPLQDPADGNIFEHMAEEGEIVVKWFGDTGDVEYLAPIANPLRDFFASCIRESGKAPAWEMDQFETALYEIVEETGGIEELWKKL